MKGIEFVCMGNNGRSPMAEVVAKEYVERIDANIPIFSSGVSVTKIFEQGELGRTLTAIAKNLAITGTPIEIANELRIREDKFRNEALAAEKYSPLCNHMPRQTDLSNGADLLIPVGRPEKSLLQLRFPSLLSSTYGILECHAIAEYVGVEMPHYDDLLKVQDWFSSAEQHKDYLDKLIVAVPKIVDKYINEFVK